ncbi:MAG: DUF4350 domain-containing protein [Chloroflexota bacterium]
MSRNRVWIALGLVVLPVLARTLWHYRGIYRPTTPIQVPSYSDFMPPQPPVREASIGLPEAGDTDEPARTGQQKVVLFDQAHTNHFEMAELQSLTSALSARGARIEVLDSSFAFDELGLEGRLKYASAYVVVAPFDVFSPTDVAAVTRFVERGGRLLVILDPTRTGSGVDLFGFLFLSPSEDVATANQLLEPFDLVFSDDYLYNLQENEGNFRNVLVRQFADDPLTEGLQTITLYAGRSVETDHGMPLLLTDSATFSSLTDSGGELAAAALGRNSGAMALGDLTFLTSPYNTVADNARFIHNLAAFLLGGERQRDLSDLPFMFSGPVSVIQSGNFTLQAETLVALQRMSTSLETAGVELVFPEEVPDTGDLLVLAFFEPDPAIEDLIDPLELVLPAEHPDGQLTVPGFGSFNPAGIGLVGLTVGEDRTIMVLLAEDQAGLVSLLETVGSGLLSDCLLSGAYVLCQVGEGQGFASPESLELDLGLEETLNQ